MTLNELRERDYESAFSGWIPVRQAKEDRLIPEQFHKYFNDKCSCGSEIIIKNTITEMTCCDLHCPVKTGYRVAEMLHRFGIKGLKEATCSKIYTALLAENERQIKDGNNPIMEFDSYIAVLTVPWSAYPFSVKSTAKGAEFYAACQSVLKRTLTFSQMVSYLAIPELNAVSDKLFAGYSSFAEMLDDMKACGSVMRFCFQRGVESASLIYNLRNSLDDICIASIIFNESLRNKGRVDLSICMTGSIVHNGSRTTKEKFLNKCNQLVIDSRGVQLFEITMNAAEKSNPFILFSNPSGDRKYVTGADRGVITDDYGEHPVLLHVNKFYNFLERVMMKWNEEIKTRPVEELNSLLLRILPEAMAEVMRS